MILHRLPKFAYAALTVAALAFASGPAWAQKGGGHGHGGGGEHHGGGGEHHGDEHHGGGWGGYYGGYGYGYYPYLGWGLGRALWGGYPYGGYRGYYNDYYPYDSYYYGPNYYNSTPSYNYSQPAPTNAPRVNVPENAALIDVRVPDNAQVWIDDQQTKQTGPMREFVTPSLDQGQEFSYDIKARWTDNGQTVERHRKVTFHAGDRLMVNMMTAQGSQPAASSYYGRDQQPSP